MLAPKSTHKRKRSSARSDKARKLGPARWIVNVVPPTSHENEAGPPENRRLARLVDAHPFNRSLELILPLAAGSQDTSPETNSMPAEIQSLVSRIKDLAASHRSYRARVPISMLLDPIYVTAYLKTGSLIALSGQSGTPGLITGLEDTVCIDGQGTLVLSLCKDTYQTLGLTGRASHFSRLASGRAADRTSGPDSRFIVELPLLSPSFVPGKKGYQQALDRLRAWDLARAQALAAEQTLAQSHASSKIQGSASETSVTSEHATWDLLFVWSPSRATTEAILDSGSSSIVDTEIRFPEHLVRAADVQELHLQASEPVITDSVWIPALSERANHPLASSWRESQRHFSELEPSTESNYASWPVFQDRLQEVIEWAGLVGLGASTIRTFAKPDSACVYSPPSLSVPGRTIKLSWSGPHGSPLLLSPLLISQIASEVDRFISESNLPSSKKSSEKVDWATLSCSGFPHAPLTWRAKIPLSSLYGAKELPSNRTGLPESINGPEAIADVSMTDASSSEEEEDDDSDSSVDLGQHRAAKRKTKKRSKRNVNKNQTEHSFTPSTGETGWTSFCVGTPKPAQAATSSRWVFVELIGTDTRS